MSVWGKGHDDQRKVFDLMGLRGGAGRVRGESFFNAPYRCVGALVSRLLAIAVRVGLNVGWKGEQKWDFWNVLAH